MLFFSVIQHRDSDDQKVLLRDTNLHTSGKYKCEVSAERPNFNVVSGEASMEIIGKWTHLINNASEYRDNDDDDDDRRAVGFSLDNMSTRHVRREHAPGTCKGRNNGMMGYRIEGVTHSLYHT